MHCLILKMGFVSDVYVSASLIRMYSRVGFLEHAQLLFDEMLVTDRVSWNALISGYCQNGNATEAFDLVNKMMLEGLGVDSISIVSVMSACAQLDDSLRGRLIHLLVLKLGAGLDRLVSNALINMYGKVGQLECSQKVFDRMIVRDIVSWNSIIAAYDKNSCPDAALFFLKKMQQSGLQPDLLTVLSLSSVVAQLNDHQYSKSVHGFITRQGWFESDAIIGNAVVNMYAKIGNTDSALLAFKALPTKDVISWNSLIAGYMQNGLADKAVELFHYMRKCGGIPPNEGTWVSILPAYAQIGSLQQGMRIHGLVIKCCQISDIYLGTCLIDMYGKCGKLANAMSLFNQMAKRTAVVWNAVISCHALHGLGEVVLVLFKRMLVEGVKPDQVTLLSLLLSCSHSGLINEGERYFNFMQKEYGIEPTLMHYGCMVDLFGRAGYLEKAYSFIRNMPIQPDASVWGALLSACRIHGHMRLGKLALDCLLAYDSENVGYYVLLSNIYANMGKWEGVDKVRTLIRGMGLRKTPGWSSIELNNEVEVFYTGIHNHPKLVEIRRELRDLFAKIKMLGYVPDFSFVPQDVEEDEKEQILMNHSERFAFAYGIINTSPKGPI